MQRRSFRLLLTIALLLAACRNGGVENVTAHTDRLPTFVAVEQSRIGSVDDAEHGFSQIGGVVVDSEGFVYVLEAQALQVRVYDQETNLIRTIGRAGEGPGEFRMAHLVGLRGDTLAVSDRRLARVSLFARSGGLIETLAMPLATVEPFPGVVLMMLPGRFWGAGFAATIWGMMTPPDPPTDSFWVPHLAFDRSGQIMDTVRLERWGLSRTRTIDVAGRNVIVPTGPSARPLFVDDEIGAFHITRPIATSGRRGTFTITRTGKQSDTLFHIMMQYQPVAFPPSVVESIVSSGLRSQAARSAVDTAVIAAAMRKALELPPWQPPVATARVGADGQLWIRLHDEGADEFQWVIIAADGSPRGSVKLPRQALIQWSRGNELWAAESDSLDVPWLVKYELRPVDAR